MEEKEVKEIFKVKKEEDFERRNKIIFKAIKDDDNIFLETYNVMSDKYPKSFSYKFKILIGPDISNRNIGPMDAAFTWGILDEVLCTFHKYESNTLLSNSIYQIIDNKLIINDDTKLNLLTDQFDFSSQINIVKLRECNVRTYDVHLHDDFYLRTVFQYKMNYNPNSIHKMIEIDLKSRFAFKSRTMYANIKPHPIIEGLRSGKYNISDLKTALKIKKEEQLNKNEINEEISENNKLLNQDKSELRKNQADEAEMNSN